ncbi:MAG: hypothetical protein JWL61_4360 [Gemmatimonadetes bacterium]|nr:hypothetical protein [Gemmatimonadota bacterium]
MPTTIESSTSGRRGFLGQLAARAAAGAGALGLAGGMFARPGSLAAATVDEPSPDAEKWLDGLKGKHRQLVDAYSPNEGFPLGFAHNFLATQAPGQTAGAVIVLRHFAMPIGMNHDIWARYKVGEAFKVTDPATKAIAVRNPYYQPPTGVLFADDIAVDRLLQRDVIIGACNVALTVISGMLAGNAGVSKEVALAEWKAGLIPGVAILPSGVWGVNRAQEKGCTYCAGG